MLTTVSELEFARAHPIAYFLLASLTLLSGFALMWVYAIALGA